ncbi:MAG: TonB-dependent receptor [Myxococcales bacterium]|nr:TonB-dependent receptor [Myxococcales bacterium]
MRDCLVASTIFLCLLTPRVALADDTNTEPGEELEYGATAEVEAIPSDPVRHRVAAEDLRRVAGARGDALRAVEILPGVARSSSFEGGAPVLRGAGQHESVVFLDGAPVPLLYHFASATSFFPSRLLEHVDLIPSNFSVRYGRLVGGVIEARTRAPATDRVHALLELSLLDSAALVEAPLGNDASVAVGARRSNIDFFFRELVPEGAYSVVAAPIYYDYQAIGRLRLGAEHRLRLMAYGSRDGIQLLFSKPVLEDPGLRGEIEGVLAFHRVNATLESSPSSEWSQRISLTLGTLTRAQRVGPLRQNLESLQLLGRVDQKLVLDRSAELAFGIDAELELADGRYRGPRPPSPEGDPSANEGLALSDSLSIRDEVELVQPAIWLELTLRPDRRVTLVPGARIDWYGNLGRGSMDPRLSSRLALGETTTLKGGVGLFTQPAVWYYALPKLGNPALEPYHALHTSVGVEQALGHGVKLDVAGYYKYIYDDIVGTPGDAAPHFENTGSGRIFGGELSLELRPSPRTFVYAAYSLTRSERRGQATRWRLFDHDQTHVLSAVASEQLGSGWSVGGRFRWVSGDPATPVVDASYDARVGQYRPVYGPLNSERRPAFHQLDLRVEKEWRVAPVTLAAYVELLNAYNAKNEESTRYSYDYSRHEAVNGLPILPNIGLRGEL